MNILLVLMLMISCSSAVHNVFEVDSEEPVIGGNETLLLVKFAIRPRFLVTPSPIPLTRTSK